jgi:DNA-binding MarR family transcriptional regulator
MRAETRATAQTCRDIRDDFGFALVLLSRAYTSRVAKVLEAGIPHGPRGFQILTAVLQGEQPSQLALAGQLGIDRTVMTYVIDDLVAAGLVKRQLNPDDRRQRKIVATPQGVRTLARLRRAVDQAEEEVLGPLDDAERSAFRELLAKLTRDVADPGGDCGQSPC